MSRSAVQRRQAPSQAQAEAAQGRYETKLDLFAKEFDSEDKLRRVIADLLRKMGHEGVQINHGRFERGKDILFHGKGPMGERRLFACVVKNKPITGGAHDLRDGAPAIVRRIQESVINQIEQGFTEPLVGVKGSSEWVDSVYVISPFGCPQESIDAVKGSLHRSGQIVFVCGQSLLELFAQHWKEFLWFESSILSSYLSALRKGLESDYALASLILRRSYLARSPGSLTELYVEPRLHQELHLFKLTAPTALPTRTLEGEWRFSDVEEDAGTLKRLSQVVSSGLTWAVALSAEDIESTSTELLSIAAWILRLWEAGYTDYAARAMAEARRAQPRAGPHGLRQSRWGAESVGLPSKRDVAVELKPPQDLLNLVSETSLKFGRSLSELRACISEANDFSRHPHPDAIRSLGDSRFLTCCRLSDTFAAIPFAMQQRSSASNLDLPEDILDRFSGSLLITGPAGFGKTVFCRWHAIRDANRLVDRIGRVLPVYVALHPLSHRVLPSFVDAFFANEELRNLIDQQAAGQSPFDQIRLYLDGLDEVTPLEQQRQIAQLAEGAVRQWSFLQVIMTGRDHVSGQWLRWLPRIRLAGFDDCKVRQFATKWLQPDSVDAFLSKLAEVPGLSGLMRVPLLATLILAVYRKTLAIPPNKTNLYSLFTELLCGGWDFYKEVQRGGQFGMQDKGTVLTRLAAMLHQQDKRDASEPEFKAAVKNTFPCYLPAWEEFLCEILEDGLLVRVGKDLTFSHLSFQEFLAARDLGDPAGHRPKQALGWYYMGKDWWREVVAFYITMSDRPAEMEEWIVNRALAATTTAVDLGRRVEYLRRALWAAFPGYSSSVPPQLAQKLERRLQRLGGAVAVH